jgi:hypothetical protein
MPRSSVLGCGKLLCLRSCVENPPRDRGLQASDRLDGRLGCEVSLIKKLDGSVR